MGGFGSYISYISDIIPNNEIKSIIKAYSNSNLVLYDILNVKRTLLEVWNANFSISNDGLYIGYLSHAEAWGRLTFSNKNSTSKQLTVILIRE